MKLVHDFEYIVYGIVYFQGFVQHQEYNQQYGGGPQAQTVSIFDVANQKLLDAGFPRWNLGSYTVEPIASVGCLLAGFMFGLQGILFAALLFFVVKWSQQGSQQTRGSTGGQYWPGGGGGPGGHRLGQS